ncbi:FluC/FEX family fluoride channel [Neomicrococcus lactis]
MPSKGTSVSHSTPAQLGANSWGELRRRSSDIPWVLTGGFLGTLARYFLGFLGEPLWVLVAINSVGCLLLGMIFALRRSDRLTASGYALWGTGVMGSFTTFSGVMVLFVAPSAGVLTWLVVLASIALGIALAWLGQRLVGRGTS